MSFDEKRNGLDAQPGISTSNYLLIGDSAYGYTIAATIPAIGLFGDFDAYALTVDPGFSYTIGAYSAFPLYTPNPFNTNFAILDRFGNILALSADTGAASFFTFTAIDSLYYVQAYSDSIGHYSLLATNNTIFENNSVGQTLSLGAALQGRLDFTSDVDRFGFSAIAGRTYAFTLLTTIPDAFLDVEYSNVFVSNLVSNGSGIYTFTAQLSGIYDLHISANRFTSRGDYSIRYVELDVTPPLIASASPADEATGVDIARNIEVQFSEQVQRGAGTISIRAVATNAIFESYSVATSPNLSFAGSMLTINPTVNLSAGAQYRVEFSSDSVRDLAGNAYAGSNSYNFTTAMAANPTPGAIASTVKLAPSGVEIADALTNGSHWVLDVTRTVTWAIADSPPGDWKWSASDAALMRDAMTSILANYAEVANVRFQYAGWGDDIRTSPANIVVAATLLPAVFGMSGAYARAFFPYEPGSDAEIARLLGTPAAYPNASGDVLLNFTEREMSGSDYLPGTNGYFALMHEVGHALGLKHPHDNGGTAGRKTFAELGFTAADNQILTIMSYDPATSYAAWLQRFRLPADAGYPATLMPLDVLVS